MLPPNSPRPYFFYRLFLISFFSFFYSGLLSQDVFKKVDSLKSMVGNSKGDGVYISTCFSIADSFMDLDQYDSAQIWLNKVSEVLPLKEFSLSNYFLSTRQAEVYYYNGLQRLGLQESERSLTIAKALKDSLLLADACNFIGLFLINLDSNRAAIPYFKQGIRYAKQPPFPPQYLSLTKPHHLYGNMAEAYEKIGIYDSAVYLSRQSLQLASEIDWKRGIAVADNNLGNAFLKLNKPDSALRYYQLSRATTLQGGDFDVELLDYGGLARSEDLLGHKVAALQWLQEGFVLIKNKPSVNNLFANQFLNDAILVFKKYHQQDMLTAALEKKAELLQKQVRENNRQMNVILNAGLKNETRLLSLQVKQVSQENEIVNTRLYLLLSLLILGGAGFLLYRYKAKQRLEFAQFQNKISQDLHDDVGSSLSSLQVYGTVAEQVLESQPEKAREMLQKINLQSGMLMENIGDIVWSMKPDKDQLISLTTRIKNFVTDVLSAANINYKIVIEDGVELLVKNIAAKRNILLIIKEAVNNAVKYSGAKELLISIKRQGEAICVQVIDNGKGFDTAVGRTRGDGLVNMQKRTEELKGSFAITSSSGNGTTISAVLPIPTIRDTV
jgi:signal transduction histidine kinase